VKRTAKLNKYQRIAARAYFEYADNPRADQLDADIADTPGDTLFQYVMSDLSDATTIDEAIEFMRFAAAISIEWSKLSRLSNATAGRARMRDPIFSR
jgi:hypothetical protein